MLNGRNENLVSLNPVMNRFRRLDRDPTDQKLTILRSWHSFRAAGMKKAQAHKLRPFIHFGLKAGDGIRTHDVQLGNPSEPEPSPLPDKAQEEPPKEDTD